MSEQTRHSSILAPCISSANVISVKMVIFFSSPFFFQRRDEIPTREWTFFTDKIEASIVTEKNDNEWAREMALLHAPTRRRSKRPSGEKQKKNRLITKFSISLFFSVSLQKDQQTINRLGGIKKQKKWNIINNDSQLFLLPWAGLIRLRESKWKEKGKKWFNMQQSPPRCFIRKTQKIESILHPFWKLRMEEKEWRDPSIYSKKESVGHTQ